MLLPGLLAGCASPGLLAEHYDASFYEVPRRLPDTLATNPTFLAVGDTQANFRVEINFWRRENWATWKQLLVPFYQLYLLGNGITGLVNYYRNVPDSGSSSREAMRQAVWKAAQQYDADFLLHLGDIVSDNGHYPEHWEVYLSENRDDPPLLDSLPILPTLGNHEYALDSTYGWPNYQAVFDYPRFYVLDTPDAAIFVLDSNMLVDQHTEMDDDLQDALFEEWFVSSDPAAPSWLERALAARPDRRFKIVAMHHPLVTSALHFRDWYKFAHGRELLRKRDALIKLLQRHNVQLVLAGHEHLYERNTLPYRIGDEAARTYFVTSSGGGVPTRRAESLETRRERLDTYRARGFPIEMGPQVSTHHFSRIGVYEDSLVVATYGVDDDAPTDWRLLDRLRIPPSVLPSLTSH